MPNISEQTRDYLSYISVEEINTIFSQRVKEILNELETLLIEKNRSYGDSAMHPVRIFSKASPDEQIRVRIDDKLSRLARGSGQENEDVVMDLLGYLVILKMHIQDQELGKQIADRIYLDNKENQLQ
jgi:hypothetical protein